MPLGFGLDAGLPTQSFFTEPPEVVNAETATTRAEKVDYVLGDKSPGVSMLQPQIANGREKDIRQQMVMDKGLQDNKRKLQIINNLTQTADGPLNKEQFDFVMGLSAEQLDNPDTILESELAKKVFSDLLFTDTDQGSDFNQARAQQPEKTDALLDVAEQTYAKMEIAKKASEQLQQQLKDLGPSGGATIGLGPIIDFVAPWLPFHRNMQLGIGIGIPVGQEIANEYRNFRLMDKDDFAQKFNARLDEIKANAGPEEALRYLAGYFNDTSEAELWGNIYTFLDIASLAPIGAAAKIKPPKLSGQEAADLAKQITAINKDYDLQLGFLDEAAEGSIGKADPVYGKMKADIEFRRTAELKQLEEIKQQRLDGSDVDHLASLISTVRAVNKAGEADSVSKIAATGGKTEVSARIEAFKSVAEDGTKTDLVRHTPAVFDGNAEVRGANTLSQGRTTELAEATRFGRMQADLEEMEAQAQRLTGQMGLERLPEQAAMRAFQIAEANLSKEININNAIARIQYTPINAEDVASNTYSVAADITKFDGSLFPTKLAAGSFARQTLKLPKGGYTIETQGNGHFVRVTRPVDETAEGVRDALIPTGYETPVRWWSKASGFRGANQIVGEGQNQARKYLLQKLVGIQSALVDLVKPVGKLKGESRAQFERLLTHLRDQARVTGQNFTGGWVSTAGALDRQWLQANGRLPTQTEAKAYWSWKSAYDAEFALHNYAAYRSLARQGITDLEVSGQGFFGKLHQTSHPLNDKFDGLLVLDNGSIFHFDMGWSSVEKQAIVDGIDNGNYKLLQIANPLSRPLKALDGRIINYAVTKVYKNKPLPPNIIKYNPAGFTKRDYRYNVAQPVLNPVQGRNIYIGDAVISTAQTAEDALYRAQAFERMRVYYQAHDRPGLDGEASALGLNGDHIWDAFDQGRLNSEHPIGVTKFGEDSIDLPEFRQRFPHHEDSRRNPLDLDKGASASVGLEDALFPVDTQTILDPYVALSRSMGRMANNGYLQDYQILSAEQFVREFWDVLDVPRSTLEANPIPYLMDPKWSKSADPTKLAAAKNFQLAVRNLMGVPTKLQSELSSVRGRLYESVYGKFGAKAADVINDSSIIQELTSPVAMARGLIFHLKIGLGNVTQLWKQAQTLAVSTAVVGNPKLVTQGMGGILFQGVLRFNPKHIDQFDTWATSFGWGKGQFKELWEFTERSNILKVDSEHAYAAGDLLDPNVIQTVWGKVLDIGSAPFSEGERMTRMFAMNAAYLEWRNRVGPLAKLNRRAEMEILKRQDQLNVNMTRASQANIQHGETVRTWLQFGNYQLRVWELMTGHTLSKAEKTRMFLMQSAMYGVPVGVGTVLPWPWFDEYRQRMLKNGQGWANGFEEIVVKGIPAWAMHVATGKEYDINTQFGAPSISLFHDTFEGENGLLETLLGATGSTIGQIASTTYPLIQALGQIGKPGGMNLVAEDFLDLAKTISGVNYADKLWMAVRFQQAVTKNEVILSNDVTTLDGILMGVFGINPTELDDIAVLNSLKDSEQEARNFATNQIIKYIRQYVKSSQDSDKQANLEMAHKYFILGDLTPDEYAGAVRTAMQNHESLFEQLNQQMMLDKVPQSLLQQRRSMYTKGK